MRKIAKGEVRRLLIVIGTLQDAIGRAQGLHTDDRSRTAYTEMFSVLEDAFNLCVETRSDYEIINTRRKKE